MIGTLVCIGLFVVVIVGFVSLMLGKKAPR